MKTVTFEGKTYTWTEPLTEASMVDVDGTQVSMLTLMTMTNGAIRDIVSRAS